MDRNYIDKLVKNIWAYMEHINEMKIMEVCGTHTQSIAKHGIASLLPSNIRLLSGPGCPVCVTPAAYIDDAVKLLQHDDVIVASFGDMIRVNGTETSLEESSTKLKKTMVIYSPFDAIKIAEKNKDKIVVFLAVGFETTAPVIASMIKHAEERSINNINIFTSIRLMPPILEKVMEKHNGEIDGMICPGHVATIMGQEYFLFLTEKYGMHSVIAGFEALDILAAIYFLVQSKYCNEKPEIKNIYKNCVSLNGNEKAKAIMNEVFGIDDGLWRGIGIVHDSAMVLKDQYAKYDAVKNFNLSARIDEIPEGCSCGDILIGKKEPRECSLFDAVCSPENPRGPCMVSSEGSCSVYYKYRR